MVGSVEALLMSHSKLFALGAMEDYLRAKGMWYWIHADRPAQLLDPKGWRKRGELGEAVGEI